MKLFAAFLTVISLSSVVLAGPATDTMARIRAENKLRFNDHGFINDPALTAKFSASQRAAIQQLRQAGNLKRSFRITNNAMSDLVITVSLVQELNGEVAGLLVERNRYDSAIEEANLRLFNIPILLAGMNLFSYNGVTMVSIKAQQLTPTQGGRLDIKYPTNYKSHTYGDAYFDILRTTVGDMSFFTLQRKSFTQADVRVWMNIFDQNFGVESVNLR